MIALSDVKLWLLDYGVGHIVASVSYGYWHTLLCDRLIVGGETTTEQPKRICRKCRAAMKTAAIHAEAPR